MGAVSKQSRQARLLTRRRDFSIVRRFCCASRCWPQFALQLQRRPIVRQGQLGDANFGLNEIAFCVHAVSLLEFIAQTQIRSSKCEMWSRSVRSIKNWILGRRFAYSANIVVNTPSSSAEVPLGSSVNGRSHSPKLSTWIRRDKLHIAAR